MDDEGIVDCIRGYFWSFLFNVGRKLKLIICFFVGHEIRYGYDIAYESDWCERCMHTSPEEIDLEEGITMPRLLNRVYCWLVERHWSWFERFDLWLQKRVRWAPSWWEY